MSKLATVEYLKSYNYEDVDLNHIYRYMDRLYNTQQEKVQNISEGGYPLSFSLFNGSQYEGYTMLPIIDDFWQRFNLGDDFVVVADSGLMSGANVKRLRSAGYMYIIGASIKSVGKDVKEWILSHEKKDAHCFESKRDSGECLIVRYPDKRVKKDAYIRDRGITWLHKVYSNGELTKAKVNRGGYNKFL